MAEKFYHTNIKNEIKRIAEASQKYKQVGIETKVPLPHPNMELVFHYKPEAILITKAGKKYIFEVLDDQLKDYNLIVADIIQSYLVENISKVFFISKNDEGTKLTRKLSGVIGAILEKKGFFRSERPDVLVYTIAYKEARSCKRLNKILKGFAKKDKWN